MPDVRLGFWGYEREMAVSRIQLLDSALAQAWASRAAEVGFVDGRVSATGKAKAVKANKQMAAENGGAELLTEIENHLMTSALVHVLAFPKVTAGLMVNAYGPGESYGWHVDASTVTVGQDRVRRDMSFTIALAPPDSYEGGELQFYEGDKLVSVRLALGEMVLYPTGLLHQVTPVTRGERLSCVGWFQSWIQSAETRAVLSKLRVLNLECERLGGFPEALALRQNEAFHMLFRQFAN